jgi:Tail-tube assembly protein
MSFISETKSIISKVGGVIKKTYGPLSPLDNPMTNFTWGNLRYPLDVGDNNVFPHTVEFQCWIPKPTGQDWSNYGKRSEMPTSVGKRATGIAARSINVNEAGVPMPTVNTNQQYNKRLLDFTRRADPSDLIVLYSPTASWTDTATNNYEAASMTDAIGGLGMVVEAGQSIKEYYKGNEQLPTTAIAAAYEAIVGVASKALGADGGIMKDVGFQSQGYAINPQYEQIYKGTGFREFQFVFKMTPRNEKEAEAAFNIARRFKYHASPEYTAGGGRYIVPPSYFDIEFKYLGVPNPALPRVSTCVLQKLDVSYGGDLEQLASFKDGKPVQITMTMQFIELETMHKALRDIGY